MDVMVQLGLHLGRRAFPLDGGIILQRIFVLMNLSTAGVQKKGPAKKREDKGKLKRRNFLMEVEE